MTARVVPEPHCPHPLNRQPHLWIAVTIPLQPYVGPAVISKYCREGRVGGRRAMFNSRRALILAFGLAATGCTNLDFIQDPQFGVFSSDQIEPFLKSVRCELITFYTANEQRTNLFNDVVN